MMQNNYMDAFRAFMQNPMQFMLQRKINVPAEYMNNPDAIIQYLMDSGKLSQTQYNQAKQIAEGMNLKRF